MLCIVAFRCSCFYVVRCLFLSLLHVSFSLFAQCLFVFLPLVFKREFRAFVYLLLEDFMVHVLLIYWFTVSYSEVKPGGSYAR